MNSVKCVVCTLSQSFALVLAIAGCSGSGGGGGTGTGSGPGPGGGTGPDAGTVVFQSTRSNDGTDAANYNLASNIWRVNTDGTDLTPITTATAQFAHSENPHWSPDGTSIVFRSTRKLDGTDAAHPNLTFNIWRVNADGGHLTPLTNASAVVAHAYNPRWSPDGMKVVFHSSRKLDGTDEVSLASNIWRVNADGSGLTPLTKGTAARADSQNPQWSPDGAQIVFQSRRHVDGTDAPSDNLTFNIWRVSANGSGLTPLTNATVEAVHSHSPQWSPDGRKIVFQSRRNLDGTDAAHPNLTYNLWQVNADGSGLTPLTKAGAARADSENPQWSPDGTRLVFHSRRKLDGSDGVGSASNIWRVNADGSGLTPLTTATKVGADSSDPQWSPDGTKVIFASRRNVDGTDAFGPTFNIWSVNADGTGLTPLTRTTASGTDCHSPQLKR